MKRIAIALVLLVVVNSAGAQTLFTVGGENISKAEFTRAFNKNRQNNIETGKAIKEYLELYTNFKLKVKAAKALGLDTVPQLKYDVENFKKQISENYIGDERVMQQILKEAWQRSRTDLHVQHFLVPFAPITAPADSLKFQQVAKEIEAALKKGNTDYQSIAANAAQKIPDSRTKDLGFISAFTLPYQYENIIYATKPGGVSEAYKAANGWHIFKVLEQRKSVGRWKIAQILFASNPNASAEMKQLVKTNAEDVYAKIKDGKIDFISAVKAHSNDRLTISNEGQMPEFSTGTYSNDFEKEVFKLTKDGEISKPFSTSLGWHIVKRISVSPIPDTLDAGYQYELKQKVQADGRMNTEKERFAMSLISKTGAKTLLSAKEIAGYADSVMANGDINRKQLAGFAEKKILAFPKQQIKGSDWLSFVMRSRNIKTKSLWQKFVAASALDYYRNHLEDYNEEYYYQVQEFVEGNMLFEIMDQKVWNKAGEDNEVLKKYYEANKEKYKWGANADLIVFNCPAENIAQQVIASVNSGKRWKDIVSESNNLIQADSGRYEIDQIIDAKNAEKISDGMFSKIIPTNEGTYELVYFVKIYPTGTQRSFNDARGLVIGDYQNVLENEWLTELRKKYPVKLNQQVYNEVLKNPN